MIRPFANHITGPSPGAHFQQPPHGGYGAPAAMSPYGQMPPQSAGGFGRGNQGPAGYMGQPQGGNFAGSPYGGYQG